MTRSIWLNRFLNRKEDPEFEALNRSIHTDARLFREEIAATRAHAHALHQAGIYNDDEKGGVLAALDLIETEIEAGSLGLDAFEDIHTVVESRLTELTGSAGAKIQTGRSRNEQTVTAQRLYLKKALSALVEALSDLQQVTLERAEGMIDLLVPGFTHMRPAQPIRFSFYLCSLFYGLARDKERASQALKRVDTSPAGTGALAGAPFGLDRQLTASLLGFARVSENALDTVSDRDCNMELLSVLSILLVRLSRFAEDLLLWSSPAFGFVTLDDAYCTSSSLMPQKKNPDSLELVRGKAGCVISSLVSLLITCKGLPMGYQKDLQEDKAPLFEAMDTTLACVKVFKGIIASLSLDAQKALNSIPLECLATDQADEYVREGMSFRQAYDLVAESYAKRDTGNKKTTMSPEVRARQMEASVERRNNHGGTSREAVLKQIAQGRKQLKKR
ncbi:MAG: argininosuccinate lyase [Planctomycetota bacterium]